MQDWVTGKGKGRRATHKALCCWQWGLWALSRDPPRERSAAGPQLSPDGREQKGQQPRRGGLRAAGFVGIWRPRGTAPPRRVDNRAATRPKGRPRHTACPQPGFLGEVAPVPTRDSDGPLLLPQEGCGRGGPAPSAASAPRGRRTHA